MNIRAFVRGSNAVVVNKSHGGSTLYTYTHAILSRPVVIEIIIINTIIVIISLTLSHSLSHSSFLSCFRVATQKT